MVLRVAGRAAAMPMAVLFLALFALAAITPNAVEAKKTTGSTNNLIAKVPQPPKNCYWLPSSYGECDKTCGTGIQSRSSICYCDADLADESDCKGLTKPVETTSCELSECVTYEWSHGEWSGCADLECGSAFSSRSVQCVAKPTNVDVDPSYCVGPAPEENEVCAADKACVSLEPDHVGLLNATWNWGEWTECSASCGHGHETRDRWCIGREGVVDDTNCDCDSKPTYRVCNLGTCESFEWKATELGDCSVSCGSGFKERTVQCVSNVRGVVPRSECAHLPAPVDTIAACEAGSCPYYYWVGTGFGDCSVTCGAGEATQSAKCINGLTKEEALPSLCPAEGYPDTVKSCNDGKCVICGWSYSPWDSECSVSCGLGQKTRQVDCSCSDGTHGDFSKCKSKMPDATENCVIRQCPQCKALPSAYGECTEVCGDNGYQVRTFECDCVDPDDNSLCSADALSAIVAGVTQQECNRVKCPTYEWVVVTDDKCSAECGSGWKTHTVTCVSDSGVVVEESYCAPAPKPDTQEACVADKACKDPEWQTGPDSDCSASCGSGTVHRSVWCSHYGQVVDDSKCDGAKRPPSSSPCTKAVCEVFWWTYGDWSECSTTCAIGVKTRTATCVSNLHPAVSSHKCDADTREDLSQKCEAPLAVCPAYAWNSLGWSKCSTTCDAGVTTLTVVCQDVSVNPYKTVDNSLCDVSLYPENTQDVCMVNLCEVWDWAPEKWSDCPTKCGDDSDSTRDVPCKGIYYGKIDHTNTLCKSVRPETQKDCKPAPCPIYEWKFGSYDSGCSKTCGNGEETRPVWCQETAVDGTISKVKDHFCVAAEMPVDTRSCFEGPCCLEEFSYTMGDWVCEAACGAGTKTRTATCTRVRSCVSEEGKTTVYDPVASDPAYCSGVTLESTQGKCDSGVECDTYHWTTGDKSECSASCGVGSNEWTVDCVNSRTHAIVDDGFCLVTSPRPPSTGDCGTGPCETFGWDVSNYGECSAKCGTGVELRTVSCVSNQRGKVARHFCVGTAPEDNQPCAAKEECPTCDWVPAEWGQCSSGCGIGEKTRVINCKCTDGTTTGCVGTPIQSTTTTCFDKPCEEVYKYKVVGDYKCDVTCGDGTATRPVQCVGVDSGDVDASELKCSGEKKPDTAQACEEVACERWDWVYGEWGSCTRECGFGSEHREKKCVGDQGNVDPTGAKCGASKNNLPSTKDCFLRTCEVCTWQVASLSECSVSCGAGQETREVACVGDRGTVCKEAECSAYPKPDATLPCTLAACTTYKWYVGGFSDCSVSCGVGTKTREAFCHDAEGLVVDASYCKDLPEAHPTYDEVCDTKKTCEKPSWSNGKWSACSASCGSGTQHRLVQCLSVDAKVLDDKECEGTAPDSTIPCDLCACESFNWEVASWGECSVKCGTGFKFRGVECRSTLKGYVASENCDGSSDTDHEPCSNVCHSWQEGDWGDCVANQYTRNVYCVGTDGTVDKTGKSCDGKPPVDTAACA